ncbi:hypothetical protein PG994_002476 [Apiospora phragmitis]|uniref:Uncharacterized protein n=1 Tax=Apiospora phragmitis TaxID=2905665 RepID=A0ABR1WWF9_9PEZI
MCCRHSPHLYRGLFFVIDTPNYADDGIMLVKMDWDEKEVDHYKDGSLAGPGVGVRLMRRIPSGWLTTTPTRTIASS